MIDESITIGSASYFTVPVWRSTKNDPPPRGERVIARYWVGGNWYLDRKVLGKHVVSDGYECWCHYPDPNDGTTPEDWL